MKYIPIICVTIMATTLISGFVNLNFQHNLHLPKELTNQTTIVVGKLFKDIVPRQYDVYMSDGNSKQFPLRDTIELLDQAKESDTIKFHIAGRGGSVDVYLNLINHIRATKAKTIMIVEAPSYSGDAFLALSGDEVVMRPLTYLLFHTSSGYGYDCSKEEGMDRGETSEETCNIMLTAHLDNMNKLIDSLPYLTLYEKSNIENGKTVIVTSQQIKERQ